MVYGILKPGYWSQDAFSGGALEIREARIQRRLVKGPGSRLLKVSDEDFLALGIADPLADVPVQERLSGQIGFPPDLTSAKRDIVRLEGLRPCGSSLHRRVLVPVTVSGARELAWV